MKRTTSTVLLTLFFAACGSDETEGPGGGGSRFDAEGVCDLLTTVEAEALLDNPLLEAPSPDQLDTPQAPVGCIWTASNTSGVGIRYVQIQIYQENDFVQNPAWFDTLAEGFREVSDYEEVDGVGERAFWTAASLYLLTDDLTLVVSVGSLFDVQRERTLELVDLILPRL